MATTRESFEDLVRWLLRLARVGARRAALLALAAGLFALAVALTTRESASDCGEVTSEQRERLTELLDEEPGRSFTATRAARCVDGSFESPLTGLAGTQDEITRQLIEEGWSWETTYIAYQRQLQRHCLQRDQPGWERVQILVNADRGGSVFEVIAAAPEGAEGCELERREESLIYPPSR